MKAALIVNRVLPDPSANLAAVLDAANAASETGAELVLLPEAALTGLINDDDPLHDLPLGQPIPGPATGVLAQLASGLLERDGDRLYDSAVLLAPGGEIALKYRRIHPGWHGHQEEKPQYAARGRLTGATALMTNYLVDASLPGDHSFGGALVVSGDGQVLHELPLGRAGMLLVDC